MSDFQKLPKRLLEKYIKNGGIHCPFCNSSDIHWSASDIYILNESSSMVKDINRQFNCSECKNTWMTSYKITNCQSLCVMRNGKSIFSLLKKGLSGNNNLIIDGFFIKKYNFSKWVGDLDHKVLVCDCEESNLQYHFSYTEEDFINSTIDNECCLLIPKKDVNDKTRTEKITIFEPSQVLKQ